MAACGSLQHIFENPLPETAPLLESLSSWKQIKPVKPIQQSSFADIFGELHFKENSELLSSPPSFPVSCFSSPSSSCIDSIPHPATSKLDKLDSLDNEYESKKSPSQDFFSSTPKNHQYIGGHNNGESFSQRKYESLQLCTEGLGFESFDDVYFNNEINECWNDQEEKASITRHSTTQNLSGEIRRSRQNGRAFPPPISCIGKSGKPWVSFKSYRHDGRFVLKQVRIPSQELLHACREDGRLKLHFVQPSDEILEEEDGDEEVGGEGIYIEDDR